MEHLWWSLCRLWVYLRRRRIPPPDMNRQVWYFAYGSNMLERLFRRRRHMTPSETVTARLDNHRLRFVVAGGRRPGISAPADIAPSQNDAVFGVLYLLPRHKFVRLDASEGGQYSYYEVEVETADGRRIRALTFRVSGDAREGEPSTAYLRLLRRAARERRLPAAYIDRLDRQASQN